MKTLKEKIKNSGQIYTPDFIVNNMLDFVEYYDIDILEKHIIDNSCGDGAFLVEIVRRYCEAFHKKYGKNNKLLKKHLEKYIHGIEIQKEEKEKCIINLNREVEKFGLINIKWDVIYADALLVNTYDGKMDFVVGNPPYVRVHNLNDNYERVKKYRFAQNGMTDLYLVFFEIGFNMLNNHGKMCLITPSSYLQSNAGRELRKYILENKNLTRVIDLEHFQPFNATTYTIISLFEIGKKNNQIEYYIYDTIHKQPKKIENLDYSDVFIGGKMYFSKRRNLQLLKEIESYNEENKANFDVKNGFATLADDIFIKNNFDFEEGVIKVLKASTGKWYKCIFPYNEKGEPISLEKLKQNRKLYEYLLKNKTKLEKRSLEKNSHWFLFGRNQGVRDVYKNKIAINTIIKNIDSIKLEKVPAGSGVFSGLYILSDLSIGKIEKIIKNKDFLEYIKTLKKYKSGGYYTFSSYDLKKYLNYKLSKQNYE
jgi:adenine-specific DNA-methyltransferase